MKQLKQVVKLTREMKAQQIVKSKSVTQVDRYSFKVKSQQNALVEYGVYVAPDVRFCECKDHELTQSDCKHIMAVELFKSLKVQTAMVEQRVKQAIQKIGEWSRSEGTLQLLLK